MDGWVLRGGGGEGDELLHCGFSALVSSGAARNGSRSRYRLAGRLSFYETEVQTAWLSEVTKHATTNPNRPTPLADAPPLDRGPHPTSTTVPSLLCLSDAHVRSPPTRSDHRHHRRLRRQALLSIFCASPRLYHVDDAPRAVAGRTARHASDVNRWTHTERHVS